MKGQQISERLQALVSDLVAREKNVHNAVMGVVCERANLRWSGAAGLAHPAQGTPMQADTPFVIASITKMYTAATIMMLQERGRLELDDAISKHLPSSLIQGLHRHRGTDYTRSLTIRHLIGQTSGFVDYFLERPKRGRSAFEKVLTSDDREWNLEDVVRLTREELPPAFPPAGAAAGDGSRARTRAHYSDTNYKLLGAIIEAATDKPLQTVFEELIFAPLGLMQTYVFGARDASLLGEPARFFHEDRDLGHLRKLLSSHGPEGAIVSTVDDTLRFGKAFMQGELFASAHTLATMQQWNRIFFPLEYGYGLMRFYVPRILSPFSRSPELIGHSGSTGSFLYYCKEIDLYMAGTINQMSLKRTPFRLMLRVVDIVRRASRSNRI